MLLSVPAWAQSSSVGVAPFAVNGPKEQQYLSGAAQDAVVGALIKKGASAHSIRQSLDPDALRSVSQGKGQDSLVVAGRINVVGQTYRVLLKWVDANGVVNQDYLEVADVNQLLPRLEGFAAARLQAPSVAASPAAPVEMAPVPVAKAERPPKVFKPEAEPVYASAPAVEEKKPDKQSRKSNNNMEPKVPEKVVPADSLHDYSSVSQRLPYEVRALGYGDIDGDGNPEVLLTGKTDLFVYRQNGGDLQEIAKFSGKKLDTFVKVDVMPAQDGGKPWIVLTNLRGTQAASMILRFEGGVLNPVVQEIPYQLRVVSREGTPRLYGQTYHGDSGRYPTYEMKVSGNKIDTADKLEIPSEIGLYNFDYLPPGNPNGFVLAGLTPMGKLKLFKEEGGKYKSAWTSRETYGGSANDVAVEVTNTFNEVVADYYIVPLRLQALPGGSTPELIVAKNDALLKDILGRKPVISDGKMVKLKWDPLGVEEAWASKKVDGSILDYLVTSASGSTKLMVAVRMRDQNFFEGIGRKDSVLLVYDLNK
ncbi:MAG: VCBS repeat-containing protein [Deltaproteobacteria bacterium]|nr:VCBS repeat-containing protein [Deltaproteobacteria bacterium]